MENSPLSGFSSYLSRLRDAALHYFNFEVYYNEKNIFNIYCPSSFSKKKLSLFLIIFSTYLFSQGWQWQNPYPQGNFQSDVWALDSSTIVALADYGTILKSTDGGTNWKIKYVGGDSIFYFRDLQFIGDIGWTVVGNYTTHRYIFKTTDRGDTWILNTKMDDQIESLYFIDENTGWLTGIDDSTLAGRIFKTNDGGKTWINLSPDSVGILSDIFFHDSLYGFVVGYSGLILRTTDGGENWQKQTSGDNIEYILGVQFIDRLTGWIIGNKNINSGFVRKTTDGGITWVLKLITVDEHIFKKFFFINNNDGFIPGLQGKIYTTRDGGDTWNIVSISPNKWLTSVHFSDQNNGWIVGDRGVIAKTSNGGTTWINVSRGIRDENLQSIIFIDTLTGWCISNKLDINGSILRTEDGGNIWIQQLTDTLVHFLSLDFISHTTGWAVGSQNWTKGVFYKTTDGGSNWARSFFNEYYMISSIDFIDDLTGWMIGSSGLNSYFLKTTDGGNTWNLQFEDSLYRNKRIKFFDYLNGWAVGWPSGGSRFVLRTTDGGLSWNAHHVDVEFPIYDVSFVSPLVGWAAGGTEIFYNEPGGGEGIISYTNDGGVNWQRQFYIARDAFTSLDFADDLNVWAVGYRGQIYNTINGGLNWTLQWVPTNASFYSVDFVNSSYGWICGDYGTIFKTHTGGQVNDINDEFQLNNAALEEFLLLQNYPNPFNSQTIIRYVLKQDQLVTLSVYDILGQCVKVLVNETQPSGEYSIPWDGSNANGIQVTSGVYFYIINIKSQFFVKKMLLIQ